MTGSRDIQTYSKRFQNQARAERYANRFESGSRRRIDRREQRTVRKIFAELKDCRSVLDVPSGAGRFLGALAQGGRKVLEMDVAFEILTFAREKARKSGTPSHALQGDASRLPFTEAGVDCVFSNRLLHHILVPAERVAILKEFHRVSRHWVVVSFFNYKGLSRIRNLLKRIRGRKPVYQDQPTQDEFIAEVEQSGFRVKDIVPTGPPWVSQRYFILEKA